MGSPHEGIDPTTQRTMSERSTSELRPAPDQIDPALLYSTLLYC